MLKFSGTWYVILRKKNGKIHINQTGNISVSKLSFSMGKICGCFSILPLAVRNKDTE